LLKVMVNSPYSLIEEIEALSDFETPGRLPLGDVTWRPNE
jgi:hypothetical protein